MNPDETSPAEPNDAPVHAESAEPAIAPDEPRLGVPTGAAADPPPPSIIALLPVAAGGGESYADRRHPSYMFLALIAVLSLAGDIGSKLWAEKHLDGYPGSIPLWKDHLAFVLAKNKGGAWGLLSGASESVRRPFFLLVSVAAIAFIVTLYRKLLPRQHALKWGLPLVLGGALGNVFDRVRYGYVIDFVDAHIVLKGRDHHWPTFNIADVAICVGVGLMAIDMMTSKRVVPRVQDFEPPAPRTPTPDPPPAPADGATGA